MANPDDETRELKIGRQPLMTRREELQKRIDAPKFGSGIADFEMKKVELQLRLELREVLLVLSELLRDLVTVFKKKFEQGEEGK